MIGSIEITIPAQTIDEFFPEHRQMIGEHEFITEAHTVKIVIPRQVMLIGVKSKTQVDYRGGGTIYKFEEGNRDAIYSSSDECGNTHVRGLYIWEKEPQHNEILMDWWEVSKEDAREVSVEIEKVRELFGDKLTTLDESTPTCVTVATDDEFGDRLAAVMLEPEPPALYDLKMRFCRQFSTDSHKIMLRDATRESIRAYLENVALSLNLDNADRIGIKEDGPEFRRAALSIMDQLVKQSEPAPTETPEPPALQKRRRKETMRDLFLLEVKEQFCEIFKCPIEEAKFHNVRHRLLNVVADWGNEGFIDALHLKEKGDEFWNQARRVMDKIERKAKQSA